MTGYPLLTMLVFLPLAGALALLPLWGNPRGIRVGAMVTAVAELLLAASLLPAAKNGPATWFLHEELEWIPRFGISYELGIDGISFPLVLLTAFITVIALSASWRSITERVELHHILLLVMQSGIVGVFLALDLFLFYLFWEVMLIPMFLLIGIWGHGRRIYSAVKFFVYTMGGSLLMLAAIIAVYLLHGARTGTYSFGIEDLAGTALTPALSAWLFAAFLLAFAIKFPVFPLHTWLPDAHTDAPTAGSIILAALLLKTGAYGLIRFGYPLFPEGARMLSPLLVVLAVTGIVYASWIAFAQTDMKRLVAYSSVGHMGFVALGVAAWTPVALSGAVVQMVNHGVTTAALFAMVGMLDERGHTRDLDRYGGAWGQAPLLAAFFLLFAMASAGLPGLNNFVGELLVISGSFRVLPVATIVAIAGILLPLIYTTRLVQELLYAEPRGGIVLGDLSAREIATLTALAAGVLYLGLHPAPLLDIIRPAVALLTSGGTP